MLRWGLTLELILSSAGAFAFYLHNQAQGWWAVSAKLQAVGVLMGLIAAGVAVLCGYAWLGSADRLLAWLGSFTARAAKLRWVLVPLMLVLLAAFPLFMSGDTGLFLGAVWTRLEIFSWLIILLAVSVTAYWGRPWMESAVVAALSLSVVYHLCTYIPHVNNYPFSLWWSETTRYYLASTYLGNRIYGQDLPWAMKDMTRYLIQALPFLIKGSPLWVHRLWQAVLRFSSTYLAGYLLARRLNFGRKIELALFSAWAGLFLFQGPVFYHLIVVVILLVWLADPAKFWKSLILVVLTSIYAGFSRVNWVPMPAMLALAFYLLEVPVQGKGIKAIWQYLWKPAVWTLSGLAAGLAAQQYWYLNSGNPMEVYESSFTSYMLWDRLFPNPSYTLGILPAILLVSAPLLIYLGLGLKERRTHWHAVRLLGLGGMLLVLFAGGLVVSVKIGGGTNLHNLDMYLVMLLVIASELHMGRIAGEDDQPVRAAMPLWLKAAALAGPVIFIALFGGLGSGTGDPQAAIDDLTKLQMYADQAVAEGGEVLFISQRHLLTFGLIEDVPLVHDFEKMLLQEMVMGKNKPYLAEFGAQMAEQRYALIVTDQLPRIQQDPAEISLAMENNVMLRKFVPLIQCAYELKDSLVNGSLELYVPKAEVSCGVE